MLQSAFGAISSGSEWPISTLRADFVSFASKVVLISPNLLACISSMETLKEKGFMKKKTFTVHANGMDFYCEMIGQGPTIVLVPPGSNDCGPYEKMMAYLADEFTVLTFDPRGGSRSPDPHPRPVTVSKK